MIKLISISIFVITLAATLIYKRISKNSKMPYTDTLDNLRKNNKEQITDNNS